MNDFEKIESVVKKVRSRSQKELCCAALKILDNSPLLDIEAASSCNVACTFCPRGKLKRDKKIMDPETFSHVLRIIPKNALVMFAGIGEPLLNKNLPAYIKQLKSFDISSCIITNGILLTPQLQKELIEVGIDQLQISYSGVSDDALISIMGTTKYREIINENLQYLSGNRPTKLRVQLNFVLTKKNQKELAIIKEKARLWGFDLHIRRVHNRGGSYEYQSKTEESILSVCGICAAVTSITADGKVLACSNDLGEHLYFASVRDTTWKNIVAWKKQLLSESLKFKPCLKCNDDYRWIILDYLSVDSPQHEF